MLVSSHAGAAFVIGEVRPSPNDGVSLAGERRVLFENVNVEGMRRRRCSGVDALGILHYISGIYASR